MGDAARRLSIKDDLGPIGLSSGSLERSSDDEWSTLDRERDIERSEGNADVD